MKITFNSFPFWKDIPLWDIRWGKWYVQFGRYEIAVKSKK